MIKYSVKVERVLLVVLENSTSDKLLEHLEGVSWLIKWHHVSSVVHSKELKVLVGLEVTSRFSVDLPVDIASLSILIVTSPGNFVTPFLTTSPVADEIFITRVDKGINSSVKEISDLWCEV